METKEEILPTKTLQQTLVTNYTVSKMMADTTTHPNYVNDCYYALSTFSSCCNSKNAQDFFAKISHKPQRERTSFTDKHIHVLEDCFTEMKHPDTSLREQLATQLGLPLKTVQIWFQNRRAKERRSGKEKTNPQMFLQKTQHGCSMYLPTAATMAQSRARHCGLQNDTTVIQVVDSSNSNTNPTHSLQQDCKRAGKEFTIVHIPEACKSLHHSNDREWNEDHAGLMTSGDKSNRLPSFLTMEMGNIDEVFNLDLVIKTYEVLLSSNDADLLIKNWLAECELQKENENDGDSLTLEDNLRRFNNYSQTY